MHGAIRGWLGELYGEAGARRAHPLRRLGQARQRHASCSGLPNVDGALVGGASLKAADFLAIAAVYA